MPSPPLILRYPTTTNPSVNPELESFGDPDLDSVVRVRGFPGTEVLPVPVVAHDVVGRGVVEEVDGVLVNAFGPAGTVGCWKNMISFRVLMRSTGGTTYCRRGYGLRICGVSCASSRGGSWGKLLDFRLGASLHHLDISVRSWSGGDSEGEEAVKKEALERNHFRE